MNLHHFRYFVAIAEELHFGRAAARLHIAQPALSIQLKKMEAQLGGPLCLRTSRSVTLTEAGEAFYKEAVQALRHSERAVEVAKETIKGNRGKIIIGYSGSVTYSGLLSRYIQTFRNSKPDIELELQEIDPFTQLEYLHRGEIDIGFLPTFSLVIPDGITTVKLTDWAPCIAMAATHRLSNEDKVSMEQVREDAFITYSHSPNDDGAAAIRTLAGFEPIISHQESNMMSVLALVGSGLGISIVPQVLDDTLRQPGLVFKKLANSKQHIDTSMAFLEQPAKPSVQSLITHIQNLTFRDK